MKYLGSKARHADEILSHVLSRRVPGQTYVEPFVGGANVLCRVPAHQGPRLGADVNRYMVALHTALAAGWQPPREMTKAEYNRIRKNPDNFPPELVAFAATGCSFGSVWFSEFANADVPGGRNGDGNRCRQSADSCLRDVPGLIGARFENWAFNSEQMTAFLEQNGPCLVYCDPPYVNTTGYDGAKRIIKDGEDLSKNIWKAAPFWRWADALVDAGHTVFVSEYTGPKSEIYPSPPQSAEEKACRAEAAAYQQADNVNYTAEGMAERQAHIAEFEAQRRAGAEALAARWEVVWSKEVVSEFSASRGTEAKRETEKLFHREA